MNTPLVYLASPLFCDWERSFNQMVTERIEGLGLRVYLPQRDAEDARNVVDPRSRARAIFDLDRDLVLEADIVVFVLDGRVPDEGVAVELGIAYAQKYLSDTPKLLIGLKTDVRVSFDWADLNLMLSEPLDHMVGSIDELIDLLGSKAS